jgi:hypothetical protein
MAKEHNPIQHNHMQEKVSAAKAANEKVKQDDILNIVEQFVRYFEKIDRGEKNGNSIHNS